MLELRRIQSTTSLPSFPDPPSPRVIAPDRIFSMSQIELFDIMSEFLRWGLTCNIFWVLNCCLNLYCYSLKHNVLATVYFLSTLFDQLSNFKNDFPNWSFLGPNKLGTPEEGRRIQQLKCCVSTNNNKDEDNGMKTHTQNKTVWRCSWCNGYRRRKWRWQHEFKAWTRLIAFHIALIPLGKVWIQLFSLQLWINSRADWVL